MSDVHQGDRRCRRCYECSVCSRNVTQDMAAYDVLAARLAEVEAENAKFIEKLNTHLTAEDRRSLAALYGYELGVEEGRAEGQAERDEARRRLAEVEAENARLRELALVEAEGQHDEMLGATALAAERDRLAQELEDTLDRAREAIAYLRIVLEGGQSGAAREFLARFPREGDEG